MPFLAGITECNGSEHQNKSECSSIICTPSAVSPYSILFTQVDQACENIKRIHWCPETDRPWKLKSWDHLLLWGDGELHYATLVYVNGSARYRYMPSSVVPLGIRWDAKRLHPADALSTHCNMDAVRMGWKCAMASRTQSVSARYGFFRAVFRCNGKKQERQLFCPHD